MSHKKMFHNTQKTRKIKKNQKKSKKNTEKRSQDRFSAIWRGCTTSKVRAKKMKEK